MVPALQTASTERNVNMGRTPATKPVTPAAPPPDDIFLDTLVSDVKNVLKGELKILKDVEMWIPTGIPQLDIALGGGLPVGRLISFIGAKSVGKSTLSVHCMAQIQKHKGITLGLDVERSNLKSRCAAQGLDMDRYLACQPESLDTYEEVDLDTGKKVKGLMIDQYTDTPESETYKLGVKYERVKIIP